MDCSLPVFSVHGNSPGKNTGVGCHSLLLGIFPTQGSTGWVIKPSWFSRSLRPFLCSSVYSCHLFLISSASVKSLPFLFFYCAHLCIKYSLNTSNFLEEISSLSHSIVSLFLCIVQLRRLSYLFLLFSGTLHSVGYIFPFFPWLLPLFFSQIFVKPPQTTTLPSCISFSLGWFCSPPLVHCYKPLFIVL